MKYEEYLIILEPIYYSEELMEQARFVDSDPELTEPERENLLDLIKEKLTA